VPEWLPGEFRARCLPLVKYCNSLATNPRMLLLFAVLLLGQPVWYFVIELTAMNLLFIFILKRHDTIFRSFLARLDGAAA
jgi:hypothetical protein